MFNYYFVTICIAVFLMFILKFLVQKNDLLPPSQKRKFFCITTLIILTSISEWLGVFLNGKPLWTRPLHIFVKVLELSLAPIIPIICADTIGKIKHPKWTIACFTLQAFLEILSAFTGLIFKVTSNNIYTHSSFYWIYILSFSFSILYFILISLSESKKQFGLNRIFILILPLFLLFGLLFQYLGNNLRIIWLCTAIDVILMYTIYMEYTQNLDSLTRVLNRKYYESKLSLLHEPSVIFFVDVNDFKSINDTYGHIYGDQTLKNVGNILIETFSQKGECYRIGGDEFSAILPYKGTNPQEYIQKIQKKVKQHQNEDERFPFLAIGYATFQKNDNIDSVIEKADQMMYENKANIKKQSFLC